MENNELSKLQHHLSLLKEEYSKLQCQYAELERRNNVLAASAGDINQNSFVARLVACIASLYNSTNYSDIKIKFKDKVVPGHKIVLAARSQKWGNNNGLNDVEELDWTELDSETAEALLKYIYTDAVELSRDDAAIVSLMETAYSYGLVSLVVQCEHTLIGRTKVRNCVKFYSIAETINAQSLKEYSSSLISTHWDELTGSDFEHMSGPLLFQMLKTKTTHVLHEAVRLAREDVIFLFLVENNTRLPQVVNEKNTTNDFPLDLALRGQQYVIAKTLIDHAADVNIRDDRGDPLLLRTIRRGEIGSAMFLLEHNADVSLKNLNTSDTVLHLLALTTDVDVEQLTNKILSTQIDRNAQNADGFTALHLCMMCKNETVADLLLAQPNLALNLKTKDEEHTPLYYSLVHAGDDQFKMATRLVELGADVNSIYTSTGNSLLHVLVEQSASNAQKACEFVAKKCDNIDHVNADGRTALHVACGKGLHELVRILLDAKADPNKCDSDGNTPVHVAVQGKNSECVAILADSSQLTSIDMNVRNKNGATPIMLALDQGNDAIISVLVRGGADVNVRDTNNFTLLHQAIMKEDAQSALFLLENGADVDALTSENETPLQLAVHYRLPTVVEALCTRGVDMSRADSQGAPPLWTALASDQEDVASTLIRHGADPDCWSANGPDGCMQTLLHRAIDENRDSAAIFLIQAGCDRDSPRKPGPNGEGVDELDGSTPLHMCCQWGLQDVVQNLLEFGANVNAQDDEMQTALHIAIENQHQRLISILLTHPEIDLTLRNKSGLSPFAAALTFRNNTAAQAILDKLPTAAEQVDSQGRNFLHTAILKDDLESVLFLLAIHVNVNSRVQNSNLTPALHLAAQKGNEMLVRSLILAGARPDDRDSHKQSALHMAAEAGHAAIVSALIQNGADYDAVNMDGDNALHIAVRHGHLEVVRALLTDSNLNAEAINVKGRNPMHELCRCASDNSASICELFLECMPKYPIDEPDLQGNTPLLLAYMRGHGALCRVLIRARACMGAENRDGVSIFNYQVASKQLLHRLLDQLNQEPPPWAQSEMCQECGQKFGFATRKHHCRHCGRCLCSKCSDQEVPIIKFGLNKPARVCQVCFQVLQVGCT